MGNHQATQTSDRLSYRVISPYPLASVVNNSVRQQTYATTSLSKPNHNNRDCSTNNNRVVENVDQGRSLVSTSSQPQQVEQIYGSNTACCCYHDSERCSCYEFKTIPHQFSEGDVPARQHFSQQSMNSSLCSINITRVPCADTTNTSTSSSTLQNQLVQHSNLITHYQHPSPTTQSPKTIHHPLNSANIHHNHFPNTSQDKSNSPCTFVKNNIKDLVPFSVTEYSLEEMTEVDQRHSVIYHDSDEEDTLVERGVDLRPQTSQSDDQQMKRDEAIDFQCETEEQAEQQPSLLRCSGGDWPAVNEGQNLSIPLSKSDDPGTERPQIYPIHPGTQKHHSMVFGSNIGEGTSTIFWTRSPTHTLLPTSGQFINQSDGYVTESFSCVYASGSCSENSSDFKPEGQCAFNGGGLFSSVESNDQNMSFQQSLDPSHTKSSCHLASNLCDIPQERQQNHEVDLNKSNSIMTYLDTSNQYSQQQVTPKQAVSNCESCGGGELMQTLKFENSSPSCESCISQPQTLAGGSEMFSPSSYRGQDSHHISCEFGPESAYCVENKANFLDSQNCSCCFNNCNCCSSTCCTSDTKLTTQVPVCTNKGINDCGVPRFGGMSMDPYKNITESQCLAHSQHRGADTEEFNVASTQSTHDLISSQTKMTQNDTRHNFKFDGKLSCDHSKKNPLVKTGSKQLSSKRLDGRGQGSIFPAAPGISNRRGEPDYKTPSTQHSTCGRQQPIASFDPLRPETHITHKEDRPAKESRGQDPYPLGARPKRSNYQENKPCLWSLGNSCSNNCDCKFTFKHNFVAYLCCAPEDLTLFGLSFHKTLENWGYRIFIAPRDLQLTGPKYDNMISCLEERCNGKIIVVLSTNYEKSEDCKFLTHFARTLDPDSRKRNIIPVLIDNVEIPNVLKGLSIIKYNYDYKCQWLKKKLADAIAA